MAPPLAHGYGRRSGNGKNTNGPGRKPEQGPGPSSSTAWLYALARAAVIVASMSLLATEISSPDTSAISAARRSRPCLR